MTDDAPGAVAAAAAAGDELALLTALRDRLASTIDDPKTSARDLSPLTRRLQDVGERIDTLEAQAKDAAEKAKEQADADDSFDPDDL